MMTWMKALLGDGTASLVLTQKGYGHVYGASLTANLAMSYANVDGGSAPAAGDLVVWIAAGADSAGDPVADLTGSGWAQGTGTWSAANDVNAAIFAKVVVAGDLSSPPTMISAPESGSIGFWVAYSISGSVTSLSVSSILQEYSGTSAPSNQVQDSTGGAPKYAVTLGLGGTSSGSPTLTLTGATTDIDFATAANVWIISQSEDRLKVNLSAGGANVTFSKADDGSGNHMISGYVTIN